MEKSIFLLSDVFNPLFLVFKVIYEVFYGALFVFELCFVSLIFDFLPVDTVRHLFQLIKEYGHVHVDEGVTSFAVELVVLGKGGIIWIGVLVTVVLVNYSVIYCYLVGATEVFWSGAALTHFVLKYNLYNCLN